ncbi:MAG: hypothetical protein A4E34_02202 [Methanoregula sp. PtaU1.Bin006]|nr:MAG: hypothetical protein A4E34_02202 [Methanoregula sp. PtaU1.Bin006]
MEQAGPFPSRTPGMKPTPNAEPEQPGEKKPASDLLNEQKAREFDEIATHVFAPIYPVMAGQILERTGKKSGTAIDLGCGPGLLATALAEQSSLRVYALDLSPAMLLVASEHIQASGMVRRVVPVLGDVHAIPFDDSTVDLVVSRGSWFFWDDLGRAFREIHRILAPGGLAYIGGGFGNARLKAEINRTMSQRGPEWEKGVQERSQKNNPDRVRAELGRAGIVSFNLIQDETGFWAVFTKGGT